MAGLNFLADAFADAVRAALSISVGPVAQRHGTMIATTIASRVQDIAERASPLPLVLGQNLLRILDVLFDPGARQQRRRSVRPSATFVSAQSTIHHLRGWLAA